MAASRNSGRVYRLGSVGMSRTFGGHGGHLGRKFVFKDEVSPWHNTRPIVRRLPPTSPNILHGVHGLVRQVRQPHATAHREFSMRRRTPNNFPALEPAVRAWERMTTDHPGRGSVSGWEPESTHAEGNTGRRHLLLLCAGVLFCSPRSGSTGPSARGCLECREMLGSLCAT